MRRKKCLLLRYTSYIFMLRSNYPQTDRRVRAKLEKSGDCRPMTFCRGNCVKSFVDRSADFQGFCHRWSIGWWLPDDRPTFDFLMKFTSRYRPNVTANRQTIVRRSVDDSLPKNRRQTVAGIRPMIARLSADHNYTLLWKKLRTLKVMRYTKCMYPTLLVGGTYHATFMK